MFDVITYAAYELYVRAMKEMPTDVKHAITAAKERATDSTAKEVLVTILRYIAVTGMV